MQFSNTSRGDILLVAAFLAAGVAPSAAVTEDRCTVYAHTAIKQYQLMMSHPKCSANADPTLDPGAPKMPANATALTIDRSDSIYALDLAGVPATPTGNIYIRAPDGHIVGPPIKTNIQGPHGLAVDAAGTIYVGSMYDDVVETFNPNGERGPLTLKDGVGEPLAIAIDANGKIYVGNGSPYNVTTYLPDGRRTTPTIALITQPTAIAFDAGGRIYLALDRSVGVYTPEGKPITVIRNVPVEIRSIAVR